LTPGLVITDLALKDGGGLEIVKHIRLGHKRLPVLALSMHDAPILPNAPLKPTPKVTSRSRS